MNDEASRRWRLALGRYAQRQLGSLSGTESRMDRALEYLYDREYAKRGGGNQKGPGTLDPTQMRAVDWLGEARSLFPESVFETLQAHALDRYEIADLLKDPKLLGSLKPNPALLKTLLAFQGRANPEVKDKLREIARAVIDEIVKRLKATIDRAFSGRRDRFRRSRLPSAANFDWRATLRANLHRYDPARQRIVPDRLIFNARIKRRLDWQIILCIDQSGSMTDSLIHAAVMGAILSGLPGVKTKVVLFDTSIVDVSDRMTDPLETLLSVQLGGGTDIGAAMTYCEGLVTNGERTILALVTDFCEGASPRPLYASVARLNEARVKLIGLTALTDDGRPGAYDRRVAARCAGLGMQVAAMTPDRFAQWLAGVVQ